MVSEGTEIQQCYGGEIYLLAFSDPVHRASVQSVPIPLAEVFYYDVL